VTVKGSRIKPRLTIIIDPLSPGNYSVCFKDSITESKEGRREKREIRAADPFSSGSVAQAIGEKFKSWHKDLKQIEPGDLYGDGGDTAKPRLDAD
jgi:hypothetical protein